MEVFLIIVGVIIVLWTLISGLNAIIITWQNCMAVGSTDGFFKDIWSGTGGNVILILGILLLCVPVYLILSIRISIKKKSLAYRAQTRYASNPNYRHAYEMIKSGLESGEDSDALIEKAVQYLIDQNERKQDAEESVSFYSLLLAFNQMRESDSQ